MLKFLTSATWRFSAAAMSENSDSQFSDKTNRSDSWPFHQGRQVDLFRRFLFSCSSALGEVVPEIPALHISIVLRATTVQEKIMQMTICYCVLSSRMCCTRACLHLRGAWLAYLCQMVGMWGEQMKIRFLGSWMWFDCHDEWRCEDTGKVPNFNTSGNHLNCFNLLIHPLSDCFVPICIMDVCWSQPTPADPGWRDGIHPEQFTSPSYIFGHYF